MVLENANAVDIEKLVSFLVACGRDQWLYLPGVGWLTAKRYKPYVGRQLQASGPSTEKVLPFFNSDPELKRALNGLPPSGKSFPDEFARYFNALHPDLEDPSADPTLEESFTVERFPWLEKVSDEIRQAVIADGCAEVPGFGTFEVVEKAGRPGVNPDTGEDIRIPPRRLVRFKASDELKKRLAKVS
jgi:DNA-binding protein HU-beta